MQNYAKNYKAKVDEKLVVKGSSKKDKSSSKKRLVPETDGRKKNMRDFLSGFQRSGTLITHKKGAK